ncbi:3-deoxy-7-phosphoheptulonate synthase [Alkalinema sp. FACHB-956]|uniref:3-deoxy-7-phosphoheptulonate synthase n=1 Tax=Alkalinema sp. FACHB-956 TaxID=2692768 RepID=UPI001685319F|nr:3-deoxy-7-phosphoheptulonate synthase [Alkalinema sp. FACHB-956]MBD2326494.1 3-deoxy-7-phosphoheptulonate synthase [Alkalinema sp. FACHB-956]
MHKTSDLHVVDTRALMTPAKLKAEFPITEAAAALVADTRDRIRQILRKEDDRLLVIVGPCSIHDVGAALEYGEKLLKLREALADKLEIVMRVYFEKPRTTTGWKGLINDPHLDGSYDINTGLRLARKLMLDLADMGMPSATELLDPIIPQYIADLISWSAIGARTTESQTHREMSSGLSMPVGFKNGTDGGFHIAINAILSASHPHHFLGIDTEGRASIVATTGNPDCHLVLRGGKDGPNYSAEDLAKAAIEMGRQGLATRSMVDCSHGNSSKDYRNQPIVLQNLAEQLKAGSPYLMGVMVESHLVEGNQSIPKDLSQMTYGQSITDACVNFDTTVEMLQALAEAVPSPAVTSAPVQPQTLTV